MLLRFVFDVTKGSFMPAGSLMSDVPPCAAGDEAAPSANGTDAFFFKPMGEGGLRPGGDLADSESVQLLLDEEERADHQD